MRRYDANTVTDLNNDDDKGARWDPAELGPVVSDLLAKSRTPLPVFGA